MLNSCLHMETFTNWFDLYKAMEVFVQSNGGVCTKQWRCLYLLRHEEQIVDNFKKFLYIKVIKIVLDSMLYETLKWPQIAPFCIYSKKKLWLGEKNYDVHTINPQLRSCLVR